MTTKLVKKVEVRELAPMLTSLNVALVEMYGKELQQITDEANLAIERGIETDQNAKDAEAICTQALQVLKAGHNIRMEYTRPLDQVKEKLIKEERSMLNQLRQASEILDRSLKARADRIRRAEDEARRKIEEENRRREEEAEKERLRRQRISEAKGGTGENIKPVFVEPVVQPIVTQAGMRNTTKIRYIVDVEKIQNAINEATAGKEYQAPISIPGVRVYPEWKYEIIESKMVPDEFRKPVRR